MTKTNHFLICFAMSVLLLFFVTIPLLGQAHIGKAAVPMVDLFYDDFSKFPPGWLSSPLGQLNGAIQEVHYFANRGVSLGPWENAICYVDAWIAGDEEGTAYLE